MTEPAKSRLKFALRWGIAVLGVWYVVRNISLHDRVMIQDPADGRPVSVRLAEPAAEDSATFTIIDPFVQPGQRVQRQIPRSDLIVRADVDRLDVKRDGTTTRMDVLGLKVGPEPNRRTWPILVVPPRSVLDKYLGRTGASAETVFAADLATAYSVRLPYPLIEEGLISVVKKADPILLWGAILIFPLNYLITGYRWHLLMKALDIDVGVPRAFRINMVGAFYNTFMPGSTGGDVIKAYYAAKHTPHRTRAVMSVIVDRIIGLMALVILGGSMAAIQAAMPHAANDPVARKCFQIAVASGLILLGTTTGLAMLLNPTLHRYSGLGFVLRKLPMQATVSRMVEAMHMYARRPGLILATLAMSIPVHSLVIISATLACMAFQFQLPWWYYWVIVPVISLSGALPVSPQGAGVMEFFAYLLTRRQGWTVGQAVVLTMSMRLVQVFWNLVLGGAVVLRGGYHAPTEAEAQALDTDLAPPAETKAPQ